ncbi:SRPBCC domain-containing protein [Saccharopolyspora sp. NPDC050642]|uniref:SRPBCC family protein n=1 Tax=Saccharopolyspora sp. NPDC050642 TaxID=3157099 RepID=UPI0033CC6CF7
MIGQTKDVGFQIGVSKTVPHPPEAVWRFLTGPAGIALWLGAGATLEKGATYRTADGTTGEIRSHRELDRVRLTWRPADWDHDTTVQVAIVGKGDRTQLRFHQEWLADADERARQRDHWQRTITAVTTALTTEP